MKNKKQQFFFLISCLLFFEFCSVPPVAYNLQTPLNLQCSTDYDNTTTADNGHWSSNCANSSTMWIRFYSYISAPDFSGWTFYYDVPGASWDVFSGYVTAHMVNGSIIDNPTHIIPWTDGTTCNDDSHPTIPVNPYPTNFTPSANQIQGMSDYNNKLAEVIIPPFNLCGITTPISLAVTASDYLNVAESPPSNVITITN